VKGIGKVHRVKKKLLDLFRTIQTAVKRIGRTWFTGAIYCLAFAGYVFYGILWVLRFMQTNKIGQIALGVFLFSVFAVAFGCWWLLMPMGQTGTMVEMKVIPGTSLHAIAKTLEKQKVIRWAPGLVFWMKVNRTDGRMKAGLVDFRENEGAVSAAKKLLTARPVEVVVLVPEGQTIEQAASIFKNSALKIDSAAFMVLCRDEGVLHKHGIPASSVEGYLFPDTYRFPEKDSALSVIDRMIERFKRAYQTLDTVRTGRYGLNVHQFITLASIIEKEAQLASERPMISSVFHNRLKKGIPLGADPTVRYIFKNFSGPLYVSQLKCKSPYNTRVFPGLPPGPICSPGKGALQAAMTPAESNNLYFVAKWDGSGAHDFSTNFREHDRKKDLIRQKNLARLSKIRNAQN
jgi:UPF0755 protein